MEKLLEKLEQLYTTQNNSYSGEEHAEYFEESDLYNEIVGLCDEYLITKSGCCNWDNIHVLISKGYRVYAGEKGRFGWLTGCVQKNGDNRIVVYG